MRLRKKRRYKLEGNVKVQKRTWKGETSKVPRKIAEELVSSPLEVRKR